MFGKRIRLFSLLGFEVRVDLSWVIIAVLITWTLALSVFPSRYPALSASSHWLMGLGGALIFFLSIVLHEFAHSLVARRHGIPMNGITLFIFGGIAEMDEEPPSARSEFLMAIAGPIASVALALSFLFLYKAGTVLEWPIPLTGVFEYLAWINGLLAVFNLVPAFPMDGGRVLRSYLWSRGGDLHGATRTASRIGSGFGSFMIGVGLINILFGSLVGGIWWMLIGMFIRGVSKASFQRMRIHRALEGEPIGRFMRTDTIAAPPSLSIEDLVDDYVYRRHYKLLPVAGEEGLLGCVRTEEIRRVPREAWSRTNVRDLVIPCSARNTVSRDTEALEALNIMQKTGNSRLLVVEDGALQGIVTLDDLLRFVSLKLHLEGDVNIPKAA